MMQFFYHNVKFTFKHRTNVKAFIKSIFKKERTNLKQLTIIFCTDEYLLEINKTALNHNYYTDIITFDLSETKGKTIGEIYISIDRVKDNATSYNVSFTNELHRVIFHGVLHLCGYKDKTKQDITKMRFMEQFYLKKYFK
jgi:probable rRNA maturation factor